MSLIEKFMLTDLPDSAAYKGEAGCAIFGLGVSDASQHESIVVEDTRLSDDVNHGVDDRAAGRLVGHRQIHGAIDPTEQRHH